MNKLINFCYNKEVDEDGLPPNPGVEISQGNINYNPMEAHVPEPSLSDQSDPLSCLEEHGVLFIDPEAHFTANGNLHNVQIRLMKNPQEGGMMMLVIDGELFHQGMITRRTSQGSAEFHIDGMAVDFIWDLNPSLMEFKFRIEILGSESEIFEEYYTFKILGPVDDFS